MPKKKRLTARVFNYKNCPEWSVCAVVNADGKAWWCSTYSIDANVAAGTWELTRFGASVTEGLANYEVWRFIGEGFDSSDWVNSRILRRWKEPKDPHDYISSQVDYQRTADACNQEEPPAQDAVNHPGHYCVNGLECFEVMRQVFGDEDVKTFCRLNAFKYLWRSKRKNGDQDIAKAAWYTAKYRELGVKEATDRGE